jgi:uncharacterized protein (DUF305 family)
MTTRQYRSTSRETPIARHRRARGAAASLAILLAAGVAACATGRGGEPATGPGPTDPTTSEAAAPARTRLDDERRAELEALYRERMESAREDVSEADVRFMTGMITHHAQALVMSALAPTHDASPEMRILTSRIINAQNDEIATMRRWLRDRGRHVPEIEIDGLELRIDGERPMRMHGMLTDEQLRELDAARGREWDRLFLRYMIMHHQGAVSMVHELFAIDGAAQDEVTFKLASDIQVDQITEIRRMELMLEELEEGDGGSGLPR